jgi:hypothetical protein
MRKLFLLTLVIYLCSQSSLAIPYHKVALYKAAMREIGHQLLLSDNDSTSRVLPIKQVNDSTYLISFESDFAFLPGDLSLIVYKAFEGKNLSNNYIVEALSCSTNEVLYSYSFNNTIQDSVACQGRAMPKDCYLIQLIVLDESKNPELAAMGTLSGTHSTNSTGKSWYLELLIGIGLLFAFGWLMNRIKIKKQLHVQTPSENLNELKLGNSTFHPIQMRLKVKEQEFELTSKESNLLEIFIEHINQQLTRDELLHLVWGDEGDYIGRTLDVYVSKLRNKLEGDESIRLINIRGVGYKLIQE